MMSDVLEKVRGYQKNGTITTRAARVIGQFLAIKAALEELDPHEVSGDVDEVAAQLTIAAMSVASNS
jgi:hypothetical protein